MKFKLLLDSDCASVVDDGGEGTIRRAFDDVHKSIQNGNVSGIILDWNGNAIGTWGFEDG